MKSTFHLEYCKGSNEGSALYLTEFQDGQPTSGQRICGGKCWGYIDTIKAWNLKESDLEDLIKEFKSALKKLRKNK